MKSNKRKKKSNLLGIIIILIVVAFVGVFYWGNPHEEYVVSTTAGEKKLQTYNPDDTDYTVYAKNTTCMNALADMYLDIYLDSANNMRIGCAPKKHVVDNISWNSKGKFKFNLSGASINISNYSCSKTSTDEKPGGKAFKALEQKMKAVPASDFTYKNTKCKKSENYYVFDLDKVDENLANSASGKNTWDKVTTVDSSEVEEVAGMISEQDDPNEFQETDPSIVSANKGEGWEVVGNLGKSENFKSYEKAFKAQKKSVRKANYLVFGGSTKEAAQKAKKDKNGKSKSFSLSCNYKLTAAQVKAIENHNKAELVGPDGKITDYYYDKKNTTYYKGYWSHTDKVSIKYKYHYLVKTKKKDKDDARTIKSEDQSFKCKKTCTEYVKVEYGPPIQVNSGMCFEYRLKVSSVTNCTATPDKKVAKPKSPDKIKTCVLSPRCGHGLRQAGPNDDFDICVNKCDGGEYTEACSNKCYDEVYGAEENGDAQNVAYNPNSLPLFTEQVRFSDMSNYSLPENFEYNDENGNKTTKLGNNCIAGQHYYNAKTGLYDWCPTQKSGKVFIRNNAGPSNNSSTQHAARTGYIGIWYNYAHYKTKWFNYKYGSDNAGRGFIRAEYRNGQCQDVCRWNPSKGCGKDNYYYFDYNVSNYYTGTKQKKVSSKIRCPKMYVWNKEKQKYVKEKICNVHDLKKADYKNNMKIYKDKVDKVCIGKTSCTTTTATYKISFKYKKTGKEEKVEEVIFPLTKSKDQVFSEDNKNPLLNTTPEVIVRYGGCYADYKTRRWYLTEWTFPGTWLPNKGTSRLYGNYTGKKYYFVKGKVCIPPHLVNTNAKWAKYYINTLENLDKNSSYETNMSKWVFSKNSYNKPKTGEDSYEGYNILGEATTFGLFHWDFKISCFYALTKDETITEGDPEEADIRSVDTQDPFLQNASTSTKSARDVGYNWTKDATLTGFSSVVGGYDQNPQELIKKITTTDQFASSNLDFEFTLDQDDIRYIKKNYTGAYTINFNKIKYENGVSHYTSPLLKKLSGTKHYNSCNNKTCHPLGGE